MGRLNFTVKKGDTFVKKISLKNNNDELLALDGSDFKMKIKTAYDAVSPLISLEVGSGITIDLVKKEVKLVIAETLTVGFAVQKYIYDLQYTNSDGEVKTILEGDFVVTNEVTNV